jgi:hypothetical protein
MNAAPCAVRQALFEVAVQPLLQIVGRPRKNAVELSISVSRISFDTPSGTKLTLGCGAAQLYGLALNLALIYLNSMRVKLRAKFLT